MCRDGLKKVADNVLNCKEKKESPELSRLSQYYISLFRASLTL